MQNDLSKETAELMGEFGVSVIVPLLNESAVAHSLSQQLIDLGADEIIVVDGGSTDGTRQILLDAGLRVIDSAVGRAQQMNAGAAEAKNRFLLFLHADTKLPADYFQEIKRAKVWGRFDIRFDSTSRTMAVIAFFINLRSRVSGVATGDQAIFIDASVFHSVGGFPNLDLMEDVALCKRLRQLHSPYCSKSKVVTSARRWQQNGVIKTVFTMWWYRLVFFFGVSPSRLKRGYDDVR